MNWLSWSSSTLTGENECFYNPFSATFLHWWEWIQTFLCAFHFVSNSWNPRYILIIQLIIYIHLWPKMSLFATFVITLNLIWASKLHSLHSLYIMMNFTAWVLPCSCPPICLSQLCNVLKFIAEGGNIHGIESWIRPILTFHGGQWQDIWSATKISSQPHSDLLL